MTLPSCVTCHASVTGLGNVSQAENVSRLYAHGRLGCPSYQMFNRKLVTYRPVTESRMCQCVTHGDTKARLRGNECVTGV